jgi:hypothetical protein
MRHWHAVRHLQKHGAALTRRFPQAIPTPGDAPGSLHAKTQRQWVDGQYERWHQTLKNRILLDNYYLPGDLRMAHRSIRQAISLAALRAQAPPACRHPRVLTWSIPFEY